MKKIAVTISLLITLCPVVLFAKIDESQSKPILVLDEPNNCTKSQTELDVQLWKAVEKFEDFNGIKQALDAGANPNWVSKEGRMSRRSVIGNLLSLSITDKKEEQCLRALNLLFDKGAKIQWCDNEILFFPISEGFPKIVSLLIDKGADPNQIIEGLSPVEWGEYYEQPEVVSVLIRRGATPVSHPEAVQLRLAKCSSHGDLAGVIRAIQNGADVNKKIKNGKTALIEAVDKAPFYNATVVIKYLLENGANPDMADENGDRPLHIVMTSPLLTSPRLSRVDSNDNQSSPRPEFISPANCKMTIEALLKAGAKVSSRNNKGLTPLHIAAKWNNLWGAKKLIDSGAKLMDRDNFGNTTLDYAESAEMIKLLKSHGATEQ